ncbi:MAG: DUF3108 domain-containing protein [Methylotenera sp.]|uniref:DUF3108 domain-containing protein n=1 Tax=Methylotenera sp. TaxID=2051956 RepID=UPI002487191B|nr:DUF3108 domain-containing protein [Methylotenera sp.]MDI1309206.1 DUF3108 domain-containing protein [Methylotenera sp.]
MWISRYWIKLKCICQDASYRKLALALGFSLLLHLFLIGKFSFNLPNLNEQHDLIDARLVLPKVLQKALPSPVQNPTAVKKPVANQAKPNKPTELKDGLVEEVAQVNPILAQPTVPSPVDTATPIEPAEVVQAEPESQSEVPDLTAKQEPYQYVESEFDVYADKEDMPNRSIAGGAKMVYQRFPNGEQYQIKSLIQARGIAALVIPDLLQTSDGYFGEMGLQPAHYLYQFGNKKNKTYNADFNWESKKLVLKSEKGVETLDIKAGTQDLLSFMYQFMFVPPMQSMQLSITNGRKLGIYDYSFEGEEIISTKIGDLKTFHLLRGAQAGEKKTELWLALDYQHVPVKIRETNKDGQVYELLVTSLKTELPVTSQE